MRVRWTALLSSASILVGAASVSAQEPFTLSGAQLDGIIPTYQLDPTQYQLRVAVDAVTVVDPDRMRDALLMEDPEESMAAQQMPGEEPEARCTPARRALLAVAGRSGESAWEATPQQRPALTSAAPIRQTTGTASRLAAAGPPEPTIIGDAPSPAQAVWGSSRPAPTRSAAAAGKQGPASAVASRAPEVEMPARRMRSANSARPSGASAGASATDIVARVRSELNRTLSAVQGGAFRLR
jgi:hypothetical protein